MMLLAAGVYYTVRPCLRGPRTGGPQWFIPENGWSMISVLMDKKVLLLGDKTKKDRPKETRPRLKSPHSQVAMSACSSLGPGDMVPSGGR